MLSFNADPRDGASVGGSCGTCCCDSINMRPGETNLVTINYAPWSLPLTPPGIIPGGLAWDFEVDTSGCSTAAVDGFAPPSNTNYEATVDLGSDTDVTIDLTANMLPAGNTFVYSLVPLSGPVFGTVAVSAAGSAVYTPNSGYTGYDYFSYKVTDGQGRTVIRHVQVITFPDGGSADDPSLSGKLDGRMSLVPRIGPTTVAVDQRLQLVQFALTMPLNVQPCERHRLTLRQTAQNCAGTLFNHVKCFDLRAKDC